MSHRRAGTLASLGAMAATLALATSASAATSGRVQLRNSNSPAASSTPQTGSPAQAKQINFEVDLKLRDQSGAQAFARAVSTLYDVRPTHQDMPRADYADSVDSAQRYLYQTRIVDYEGTEQYCDPTTNACSKRTVALSTAPGYDSMTGLGAPGPGFVQALAGRR